MVMPIVPALISWLAWASTPAGAGENLKDRIEAALAPIGGGATVAVALIAAPAGGAVADGLPAGDPRAEGFLPETLDKIKPMLEDAVTRRKVAGASTLIARRGKVVHRASAGMRDVEAGRPVDASTLFRIASMSKPITSAAVMILVDDGKVGLDDPVAKFLPEFRSPAVVARRDGGAGPAATVPASGPITVRHLLTHTSGLSYRFSGRPVVGPLYVESGVSDGLVETPGTIGDNVRRLARLPLWNHPGAEWEYGLSVDVLGRLIEVASGRPLDAFLRDRLTGPLGMADTAFVVPAAGRDRLAALYTPGEDGTIRRAPASPVQIGPLVFSASFPTWDTGTYHSGGAGLTSTVDDYARFLQMILNRGELDGVRVLKAETVGAMGRDQIGGLAIPAWGNGDGFGYGFGVVREGNRDRDPAGAGALSWTGFFHTYFWVDVRHQVIGIFMAQIAPARGLEIVPNFKRLAYEALVD